MYILHKKDTDKYSFYTEKTPLLIILNISRSTFERKERIGGWENEKFRVIIPEYVQKRSGKGNKRGKMTYFTTKNASQNSIDW
jgi:hypothetical protein